MAGVSSLTVFVSAAGTGASFTAVTVIFNVEVAVDVPSLTVYPIVGTDPL